MILNFMAAALLLISTGQGTELPDNNIRSLKEMCVSYGAYKDRIVIKWKHEEAKAEEELKTSYRLFRSNYKDKNFAEIGVTDKTEYEDKEIIPGVKYWYKVSPLNSQDPKNRSVFSSISSAIFGNSQFLTDDEYNAVTEPDANNIREKALTNVQDNNEEKDNSLETDYPVTVTESSWSNSYSGYAIPAKPEGEKIDHLIAMKKENLKNPSAKGKKNLQNKRLNYLKQYYMNQVKFSLIMLMAKPFLNKGELLIFSGLSNYKINIEEKKVIFYDKSPNYSVTFESGKLLRILDESNDPELKDILLKNAELFCIPSGKREYRGEDGITHIIYSYDAVGLSTRYLKNDSQWKSRTIMMATSRSDLKKRLMEVSQPLEGF